MTKFCKIAILALCLTLGSFLLFPANYTRAKTAAPQRVADEEQIKQDAESSPG